MISKSKDRLVRPPSMWRGQGSHSFCLLTLLIVLSGGWVYLGKPYPVYFWVAVSFPIIHQVFVWVTWRLKLGSTEAGKFIGFRLYLVIFFLLFGGRFVSLFALAWVDEGSLRLGSSVQFLLTGILTSVGIYAGYSVSRYFGMTRAAGADHFDPRYREVPFVQGGIFRFTNNGMYLYAFLLFWAIAIGFNSSAALVVAAFSHVYIWVHFFSTEKPDMEYIYSKS